jgi:hypothetical protein
MLLQDSKLALSYLNIIEDLGDDKDGWNSWIRYVKILCWIELKQYDEADRAIERFRKYIQRHKSVSQRISLISKVLVNLGLQAYNFKATQIRKAQELQLLASTKEGVRWFPNSPELILFHDWFEAKLLKKEYKPNFKVYREAMRVDK